MKVKAIKTFENAGQTLFVENEEIEVKEFVGRFFYLPRKKNEVKTLIPFGFIEEIKEEVKNEI